MKHALTLVALSFAPAAGLAAADEASNPTRYSCVKQSKASAPEKIELEFSDHGAATLRGWQNSECGNDMFAYAKTTFQHGGETFKARQKLFSDCKGKATLSFDERMFVGEPGTLQFTQGKKTHTYACWR